MAYKTLSASEDIEFRTELKKAGFTEQEISILQKTTLKELAALSQSYVGEAS
jgi:hypothetical protein